MSRRTIVSAVAAVALSVAVAGPAIGAAPTYSGVITCLGTNGTVYDYEVLRWPKSEIHAYERFFTEPEGNCAKGSWDESGLTKDA